MAPDERTVTRLRAALAHRSDVVEKRMFGGLTFMVAGHMTCVARGDGDVMFRVEEGEADRRVDGTVVRRPTMGNGRAMSKGWVALAADAVDDEALALWVGLAQRHTQTLPPRG